MKILIIDDKMSSAFTAEQLYDGSHGHSAGISRMKMFFYMLSENLCTDIEIYGNFINSTYSKLKLINNLDIAEHPDIIVFNNPPDIFVFLDICRKYKNVKKFIWAGNPLRHFWFAFVYAKLIDGIICVSNYHRNLYLNYKCFSKVSFVYSGIDVDVSLKIKRKRINNSKVFSWISVPSKTKGLHRFLKVWPLIKKKYPDAILNIFGAIKMYGHMSNKIVDDDIKLQIDNINYFYPSSVELKGYVTHNVLYSEIQNSYCTVVNFNINGSFETYCTSAVESLYFGVPVVGTRNGSLPEVTTHGVNSVLLSNESLLDINKFMNELGILDNLSIEGQLSADHFYKGSAHNFYNVISLSSSNYLIFPSFRDCIVIIGSIVRDIIWRGIILGKKYGHYLH